MPDIELTPTSYIVLGLLAAVKESTPYQLKQLAASSISGMWSLAHSQVYKELERLDAAGYVASQQEEEGRRRKRYTLTHRGRKELSEWLRRPETNSWELRYPALLKLFFGAEPAEVGRSQLEVHRQKLAELESLASALELSGETRGPALVVQLGIAHIREDVRFWSQLAEGKGLSRHRKRERRRD